MSEADYEYECTRAELLGVSPPTWDEFRAKIEREKIEREAEQHETEDAQQIDTESAKILEEQGENIKQSMGGMEELNTILASTQVKINKFKSICGSFTNLMKINNWRGERAGGEAEGEGSSGCPGTPVKQGGCSKGDLETEVEDQVDRLDSLLNKAERAEISMSMQNKQMKSYLRK